ncbi:MAG: CpsD/CapB family tyrosine-protein kinase [Planctomycetota bacterium]
MDKAGAGGKLSSAQSDDGAASSRGSAAARPGKMPFSRVLAGSGMPEESVFMLHDRRGGPATQTRALRGRLLALDNEVRPRVLTISSAHRAEGKTTMAVNLAAALAEVEAGRVVVVDGDLEAPALHHLVGVEPKTGLNSILSDGLGLDGNVYETAIQRVDIVPARRVPDERSSEYERFLAHSCEDLLQKLSGYYSYVIVDTPPVIAASYACTFGRHSDGVMLVVRLEKTPRQAVKHAQELLTESGAKVMGCLLTHKKHHVPDLIYRMFGQPTSYYYSYSHRKAYRAENGTAEEAD